METESAAAATKRKYPLPGMAVGDSFVVALPNSGGLKVSACNYGKRHGMKFTVRAEGGGNYRCSRIA